MVTYRNGESQISNVNEDTVAEVKNPYPAGLVEVVGPLVAEEGDSSRCALQYFIENLHVDLLIGRSTGGSLSKELNMSCCGCPSEGMALSYSLPKDLRIVKRSRMEEIA